LPPPRSALSRGRNVLASDAIDVYLLDVGGHRELGDVLAPHVREHAHVVAPLVRAMTRTGAERVERWKLAVNASVESDL
jgi:hypothetical protein